MVDATFDSGQRNCLLQFKLWLLATAFDGEAAKGGNKNNTEKNLLHTFASPTVHGAVRPGEDMPGCSSSSELTVSFGNAAVAVPTIFNLNVFVAWFALSSVVTEAAN